MVAGALKKVGVEAVVEGLGKFVSDIGKMNSSMGTITGQGNILTRSLSGVTSAFGWLGDKIVDVATYALGQLLARSIEFVVSKLADLISSTVEAAAAFQTMQLRLTRLNLNDIISQGLDYVDVMEGATYQTKEQLDWIRKLAVQTPYDAQDIANVFTLARSYGFAATQAQGLTQDISDFAAGMGLGNTEIQRIIVNFGQMVQQGKVTQREMNDLARGSFVPVNDILKLMQENVGLTGAAFDKFRNSGEGVQAFMAAFSQLVATRFQGASEQMARTWQGATENLKDFIQNLVGFDVVMPVLNVVGARIADLVNSLTTPERWDKLTAAAARVGDELSGLVGDIFGLLPGTETLADNIVNGLDNIASWISQHRGDVVNFFKGIGNTIQTKVVPFINRLVEAFNNIRAWITQNRGQIDHFFSTLGNIIQNTLVKFVTDKLVPAFMQISDWVGKHSALIQDFFLTLGTIIGDVFTNLTGIDVGSGLEGLLQGVGNFMQMVIDNQESITNFVTILTKLWAVLQVVGFVFGIVLAVVTPLVIGFLSLVAVVGSIIAIFAALATPAGLIVLVLGLIVGVVVNIVIWFNVFIAAMPMLQEAWGTFVQDATDKAVSLRDNVIGRMTELVTGVMTQLAQMLANFISTGAEITGAMRTLIGRVISMFENAPWGTIGRDIMWGVAGGIKKAAQAVIDAIVTAIEAAITAAREAIKAFSPSRVFMDIGGNMMEGMAIGITQAADLAINSMAKAVQGVIVPAMGLPNVVQQVAVSSPASVNSTNNYTNNYNLSIQSQSPVEPIVQDYNMLQSLAGA